MGDFLLNNLALVALFLASGVMLLWPELSRLTGGGGNELGTLDATRLMNQGNMLVLDVRSAEEFAAGHLPRARNVPLKELAGRSAEFQKFKEKPVLVSCGRGGKSASATRVLQKAGFAKVHQLKGGLSAWESANLPLEK